MWLLRIRSAAAPENHAADHRRPGLTPKPFLGELRLMVESGFQTFLVLLAVLAGTALVARRLQVAPAILLLLAGTAVAFVPGMPTVELRPELVLLVVLPPLI